MHEMSLMSGVFEIIENTLSQYEVQKVLKVKLKIGELTNAEPSALTMAFEAYALGSVCEGAVLDIEKVPVRGRCSDCQADFLVKDMFFRCPECQQTRIQIISGDELMLESLEVE